MFGLNVRKNLRAAKWEVNYTIVVQLRNFGRGFSQINPDEGMVERWLG